MLLVVRHVESGKVFGRLGEFVDDLLDPRIYVRKAEATKDIKYISTCENSWRPFPKGTFEIVPIEVKIISQ